MLPYRAVAGATVLPACCVAVAACAHLRTVRWTFMTAYDQRVATPVRCRSGWFPRCLLRCRTRVAQAFTVPPLALLTTRNAARTYCRWRFCRGHRLPACRAATAAAFTTRSRIAFVAARVPFCARRFAALPRAHRACRALPRLPGMRMTDVLGYACSLRALDRNLFAAVALLRLCWLRRWTCMRIVHRAPRIATWYLLPHWTFGTPRADNTHVCVGAVRCLRAVLVTWALHGVLRVRFCLNQRGAALPGLACTCRIYRRVAGLSIARLPRYHIIYAITYCGPCRVPACLYVVDRWLPRAARWRLPHGTAPFQRCIIVQLPRATMTPPLVTAFCGSWTVVEGPTRTAAAI
jgi:hypothetical protein